MHLKLKHLWMDSSIISYSCVFRSECVCCAYKPACSCKRKRQRDTDKDIKTGRERRGEIEQRKKRERKEESVKNRLQMRKCKDLIGFINIFESHTI